MRFRRRPLRMARRWRLPRAGDRDEPSSIVNNQKETFHVKSVATRKRTGCGDDASLVFFTTALAQCLHRPEEHGAPLSRTRAHGVTVNGKLYDRRLERRQGGGVNYEYDPATDRVDEEASRCPGRRTMGRWPLRTARST